MDTAIKVLIVDDHVFWRRGVAEIIDAEPDMQVVADAGDGESGITAALVHNPDVILMDVNMPGTDGVEATRAIASQRPQSRIVMLSVSDRDEHLFDSLRAGAVGFLTKDVSPAGLIQAIRDTVAGESALSPILAGKLVRFVQRGGEEDAARPATNLTEREDEILRLIARGSRDREIADVLFISESTVKKHVQNVLRKLHARNRVEAVGYLERIDKPADA